jgi:UDPglucose 6-dehydrogenase
MSENKMKVYIIGQATLAEATRECVKAHFDIVDLENADLIWVCYDTPINNDIPDSEWIISKVCEEISKLITSKCIVISSQLPVGSTKRFETILPIHRWVYSPENIRVASAISDFIYQSRIVVGRRTHSDDDMLYELFSKFTTNIIFTDPETAEMVKHALNCWLGMNIAYINEVAKLAEIVEADMGIITKALKTDRRISDQAPLNAGPAFGGGHLARDIITLCELSRINNIQAPIINSILKSNGTK